MIVEMNEQRLASWKETFAKSGIRYDTDDEYREAVYNLVGYFEVLMEMDIQQKESQSNSEKDS